MAAAERRHPDQPPAARRHAPVRRQRHGRPRGGGLRGRRLGHAAAAGPAGLAGGRPGRGAVLGSRYGLGQRRGRVAPPVLDRAAGDQRHRPSATGLQQLRPRGRRIDGPLRGLHPPVPPQRLRDVDERRRRGRLAASLRRPAPLLRGHRGRAAGRRRALALGRPALLPAAAAPGRRQRRDLPARCPRTRYPGQGRAGRHRQRPVRQPPALHLPRVLPTGLQGQRQGIPADHPHPRRPGARRRGPGRRHGHRDRLRRADRPRHRRALHPRRSPPLPARGGGRGRRVLDRDPAAAAELRLHAGSRTACATTSTRSGGT